MYGTSKGTIRVEARFDSRKQNRRRQDRLPRRRYVVVEEWQDPRGRPFDVIHATRPTFKEATQKARQLRGSKRGEM